MKLHKALALCLRYPKLNKSQRLQIQNDRLHQMVDYARANSPLYAELYKDLPENWTLGDLPPLNKRELMARFDEWSTDRSVRMEDLNEYMRDLDHVGCKFHERYLVFTTSGSTGNPLVALCDDTTNNVMAAINTARGIARKSCHPAPEVDPVSAAQRVRARASARRCCRLSFVEYHRFVPRASPWSSAVLW